MKFTAAEIAHVIQGEIIGDPSALVSDMASVDVAGPEDLSFIDDSKYLSKVSESGPSVLIVSEHIDHSALWPPAKIIVPSAREAINILLAVVSKSQDDWTIDPTAQIHASIKLPQKLRVGAYAVLEQGVELGEEVIIAPYVHLSNGSKIDKNTTIETGSYLAPNTRVGKECHIGPHCAIGARGFGYTQEKDQSYTPVPHVGNVQIGDYVDLGSHCMIDRSVMGSTIISDGVKMDNGVHVAHNVRIGKHTALAAQVAIAGSVVIGEYCQIGGQAGVVGHITVADGSKVQAQTGIATTIKEPNRKWSGTPAEPFMRFYKSSIALRSLPDMMKQLTKMEEEIKNLKAQLGDH